MLKFFVIRTLITALLLVQGGFAHAQSDDIPGREGVFLAPGWGKLSFEAPAAGSYELPAIWLAQDGEVLDEDGKPQSLAKLMEGKVTLLSFIFRTCDDVNGCPLSTMVLYTMGSKLEKEPEIASKVRMLTLSFDPRFDTPDVMKEYGESIAGGSDMDWHFLTSESETAIAPILDAYQQTIVADPIESSDQRTKFSHILRVYLIDKERQVRNIYNLSFLHPDILINDVKTLLMEEGILSKVGSEVSLEVSSEVSLEFNKELSSK
ncbi:MAG: cytochrome c peroxidase [Flavobacterium sp.]|jgi:cytochrome c peroxidase